MKFVEKAARNIVPWTDIVHEMDQWDPASGEPIYKMLGFHEREWAMVVQCHEAVYYLIQEKRFHLGLLSVSQSDYIRLIGCLAPSHLKPEDVLKSLNPGEVFKNLKDSGVIDSIPQYLSFNYKAYGWNNQKLFIDLEDVSKIKFNWAVYDIPKPEPEAPRGWQPTPEIEKYKETAPEVFEIQLTEPIQVISATVTLSVPDKCETCGQKVPAVKST